MNDFWKLEKEIRSVPENEMDKFLENVPRARLTQVCPCFQLSLFHVPIPVRVACKLFFMGLDINGPSAIGNTPLHETTQRAVVSYDTRSESCTLIRLYLAFGANQQIKNFMKVTPFEYCHSVSVAKVFISNGSRLKETSILGTMASEEEWDELVGFQDCIIGCRDVIVTLLGLKKSRNLLPRLDRFLVQQVLAVEIWSTREKAWQ